MFVLSSIIELALELAALTRNGLKLGRKLEVWKFAVGFDCSGIGW